MKEQGSCFSSLSFLCICAAEWMWDTHSYARASRRRLIIGDLDHFGTGTATYHMLSRVVLARILLTAAGALEWLLSQMFAIHVALQEVLLLEGLVANVASEVLYGCSGRLADFSASQPWTVRLWCFLGLLSRTTDGHLSLSLHGCEGCAAWHVRDIILFFTGSVLLV